MPGLGPIKIIPLNHLKKNGNGLLFPIFCEKAEFALKVRESLKKKTKYPIGIRTYTTVNIGRMHQRPRPLGHQGTDHKKSDYL